MAYTIKELLHGGLPDFLDLGGNAQTSGDSTQFTERVPPTNTNGVSGPGPVPVNWPLWIGVAVAGVIGVALLVKR